MTPQPAAHVVYLRDPECRHANDDARQSDGRLVCETCGREIKPMLCPMTKEMKR